MTFRSVGCWGIKRRGLGDIEAQTGERNILDRLYKFSPQGQLGESLRGAICNDLWKGLGGAQVFS